MFQPQEWEGPRSPVTTDGDAGRDKEPGPNMHSAAMKKHMMETYMHTSEWKKPIQKASMSYGSET